ncbi:MAG: adenylate kinase, partial [Chitinophagaceae bacterium]|nr:adenylate kinase [Chitinophagaceae bacterium]
HYKKVKKFESVKGEGTVDEIFNAVCKAIDKKME